MSISATQLRRLFAKENLLFTPSYHIIAYMLNRFTVLPQHQPPLSKVQIPAYLQKTLDIKIVGTTITQQLSNSATQQLSNSATQQLSNSATQQLSNSGVKADYARINGQLFYSDNNIIIFSHQFLQTAQVVLVFLLLHTDGTLLPWAYFVR